MARVRTKGNQRSAGAVPGSSKDPASFTGSETPPSSPLRRRFLWYSKAFFRTRPGSLGQIWAVDGGHSAAGRASGGSRLFGADRKRLFFLCILAGPGLGTLAVHSEHSTPVRPEDRPVGGRAQGPGFVHARRRSLSQRFAPEVRRMVSGRGGLQCRRRQSGRRPATLKDKRFLALERRTEVAEDRNARLCSKVHRCCPYRQRTGKVRFRRDRL